LIADWAVQTYLNFGAPRFWDNTEEDEHELLENLQSEMVYHTERCGRDRESERRRGERATKIEKEDTNIIFL
jgi:hypothetical protein